MQSIEELVKTARYPYIRGRGLATPMKTQTARKELIDQLIREGMTYQEIGDILQITRERVRQLCHKYGIDIYAGREVRKEATRKRYIAAWRHSLPQYAQDLFAKFERDGFFPRPAQPAHGSQNILPIRRTVRFLVNDFGFCIHEAKTPNYTSPTGKPYYRAPRRHRDDNITHTVIHCADGRLFVIPDILFPTRILYVREDSDGKYANYRDRWPFYEWR